MESYLRQKNPYKSSNNVIILTISLALILLLIGGANIVVFVFAGVLAIGLYASIPGFFLFAHCLYWLFLHVLEQYSLELAGMNVYINDILLSIGILFLAMSLLKGRDRLPNSRINTPLTAFVILGLAQLVIGLLSGNPLRHALRDLSAVGGYIMVFVAYSAFNKKQSVNNWLIAFLLLGSLASVYAILSRITGIQSPGFEGSARVGTSLGYVSRAYGLVGAVPFYFICFFLAFALLIQKSHYRKYTKWLRAAALLSLTQLLLLFGRSVFIGLIAGLMIVGFTFTKRNRVRFLLAVIVMGGIVFLLAPSMDVPLTQELGDRYLSIVDPNAGGQSAQANIEWRKREFAGIWRTLDPLERITGKGLGSRILVTVSRGKEVSGFHNSIAMIMVTMGIAGITVYSAFLIAMLVELKKTCSKIPTSSYKGIYIGSIGSFIGILVWGFGTGGMPLNASIPVCVALGLGLQARELAVQHDISTGG